MIKSVVGLFILCIPFIIALFFSNDHDSCCNQQETEGRAVFGCCSGLAGGSKMTEYLSESCIDCPYFVMPDKTFEEIPYDKNRV